MDRVIHPALKGKPAAWFAPTYKDLEDVWRALCHTLREVIVGKSDKDHRMEIIGGGVIEGWSLNDADSGRGRAYARIVVDEAAKVSNLKTAWELNLRSQLMDYQGDAWFLSTPRGTANDFYILFTYGQDPLKPEWCSWQMPSHMNPHTLPSEIEAMKRDMTDLAFAQEGLAQFVTWQGAVFRKIMDAVSVQPLEGVPSCIGVDWGRVNDYTVFACISEDGKVLELDRFRGIEYSLQRGRLQAMYLRHGKPLIIAEANSMGQPVIEQLANDGLKVQAFTTTYASKSEIIQSLALAFERCEIKIPNDPALIGELQAFEGKPGAGGLMKYSAPAGGHDDLVMALAIGWQGVAKAKEVLSAGKQFGSFMAANLSMSSNTTKPEGWTSPYRMQRNRG